jgi:hypothetical protein
MFDAIFPAFCFDDACACAQLTACPWVMLSIGVFLRLCSS